MPDMLAPGVRWFDDWFAIREISPGVHAIGEPRFHQINWNYLVTGKTRALLFDTGPGVRDISAVVRELTPLPVTAMPSHMHFDHTGNLHRFADVAMADLPLLRLFEKDGVMQEPDNLFLGHYEGMTWKPQAVQHWWSPGQRIDLGDRVLEVISTPGHAPDHVALLDVENDILLAADFLYLGALYAQVPGSNLADYLASARNLRSRLSPATRIFGAHGMPDGNGQHDAPQLHIMDLEALITTLETLKKSGDLPDRVEINDQMYLLIGPHAYEAWQNT
jgi:glyoxylase-like metal-dependent hydrolase (beta-lactamase superfamily II)